jgi:hypothetical protein
MSVIDCAVYRHGKRVDTPHDPGSLTQVIADLAADDDPQSFLWAGLHDPTKEELSLFAGPLGLHDLAVEDAIEAHQRPKVEQYEKAGHLFMSVRAVEYHDDDIQTNEINMFLGQQFFLTVRKGGGHDLRSVRRHAEAHAEKLENGPIAALYAGGFLGPFGGAMTSSILPEIGASFDRSAGSAASTLTYYLVPFAVLMLASGTFAQRWGPQRTVRIAYIAYAVASLLAASSWTFEVLLTSRALQGAAN